MAKTIFNTTEKSNFILNLTEDKYSKMASVTLMLTCLLISVATISCEFNIEEISYPIISGALAFCGVLCMIMSIISLIKGYITKEKLMPFILFGIMLLWGIVSLINSYDKNTAFYGFDGRGEGLLALIFYLCFFITGASISVRKFKILVFDSLIAMGVLNSLWSLLQIFADSMPSKYDYIVSSGDVNACSGLSQSPLFLAMVLSLAMITALVGSLLFEGKRRKIIYTLSAILFSFVMIFTYSLISIVGILISIVIFTVMIFIKKSNKKQLLKLPCIILSSALAIVLINSGAICENNKYSLHDGPLMWFDSFNRIGASGNYNPDTLNIEDTAEVYSYLTSETLDIIKKFPLVGTGEENLIYPQLHSSYKIIENSGTFDKNYNEYLYISATRGLPSLILFIAILSFVIIKRNKNIISDTSLCITTMGIVIFFIGAGNITFSPIFWIFAGILISPEN